MAKIKSYPDINQCKKLAEILSLESADMHYVLIDTNKNKYSAGLGKYIGILPHYPCWSLAALLSVVSEVSLDSFKDGNWNAMVIRNNKAIYGDTDNPVDACYEMILKLNELNLL